MTELSRNQQLLNIAVEILREHSPRAPLHVDEITEFAIASNRNLGLSGEDFKRYLNQALLAHVNSKGPAVIARNKKEGKTKGYYRLTEKGRLSQPPVAPKEIEDVSKAFAGAGGEFATAAQLCFAGYNVSKPAIDMGVDLLAEKDGRIFNIQVKTASPQDANGKSNFSFSIQERIFQRNIANTWYVFVMRHSQIDLDFAVVSGTVLSNWRQAKKIPGKDLSVQISCDKTRKNFTLCGENLNHLVNNFKEIR